MMTFYIKNTAANLDIEAKASECYLALADEDLPPSDRKIWMDWLLEKPEHQKAFGGVDRLWQQLGHVGLVDLPSADELAIDNYEGDTALPLPTPLPRKTLIKLTAIAASLVIAVGASLYSGLWNGVFHHQQTFQTHPAQTAVIDLSDGSKITLAGDSLITTDFSSNLRDLVLVRGQAFFEVAKDAKRPFIVHSGRGYTTAIGTKFDVNNIQGLITVTVAHGLVKVSSVDDHSAAVPPAKSGGGTADATPVTLVGVGEQVSYSAGGDLQKVHEVNLEQALSWRRGYLTLTNASLPQAIEQINRYATHRIYYRHADIQDLRVSGTVYFNRSDDWLKGVEQGYAVKVVPAGQGGVLLVRKGS